jgi:hypothetical protein
MIVGIDPDSTKSGVAMSEGGKLTRLVNLSFFDLTEFLRENAANISLVVVEAGWLNQSNWHLARYMSANKAASIGNDTGRNHQTGILICEVCEGLSIKCRLSKPNKKNITKNNAEAFKKITGWQGRTNPETRDAAMLIIGMK